MPDSSRRLRGQISDIAPDGKEALTKAVPSHRGPRGRFWEGQALRVSNTATEHKIKMLGTHLLVISWIPQILPTQCHRM